MRTLMIAVLVLLSGCSFIQKRPEGSVSNYDPPRISRPNFNQIERDATSGPRVADQVGQCRTNQVFTNGRYMSCQTCCSGSHCNTNCY